MSKPSPTDPWKIQSCSWQEKTETVISEGVPARARFTGKFWCQDPVGSPHPLLLHPFWVVMTNYTRTLSWGRFQPFKGSTLFLMYHMVSALCCPIDPPADTARVPIRAQNADGGGDQPTEGLRRGFEPSVTPAFASLDKAFPSGAL